MYRICLAHVKDNFTGTYFHSSSSSVTFRKSKEQSNHLLDEIIYL